MVAKRRLRIRTKEEAIKDIIYYAKKNRKFLNNKFLRKNGPGNLFYAACKHFGTWNKAILASGLEPLQKKWDKEKVISELKKIYKETGKAPNSGEIRRCKISDLPQAAKRHFGNWYNAIKAAGFKPYRNDYWTKESLIKDLKEVITKIGHVPPKRELKKLGRNDLVSKGYKEFNGYNNFLIAAGFEPVLIPNKWTKERIIEEIILLSKKLKRTPTERDMIAYGINTVTTAAYRQFGGWNNTIIAAGLKPNESFVKDKDWKRWEKVILEICKNIYPGGEKHRIFPNKTIPDFFIPEIKKVIEVKLNASDTTIHQDIKKFSKYCEKIEIWYLKGKPVKSLSDRIRFVGPEEIKKVVRDSPELLSKLNELINR